MIPEDAGKPMSILEYISDEPREPEAYLDYLITWQRGHLAYWQGVPNDRDPAKPTAKDCVVEHIHMFIHSLETLKEKWARAKTEGTV